VSCVWENVPTETTSRVLTKPLLQSEFFFQCVNPLRCFGLGEVLVVSIRITSFLTECLEIRSLGTSHWIIARHPLVWCLRGVGRWVRVKFWVLVCFWVLCLGLGHLRSSCSSNVPPNNICYDKEVP